jgi:hypothetical protein
MEVKGDNYKIWYDNSAATVNFKGVLRLNGVEEYGEIFKLLNTVMAEEPARITLNLMHLEFLNSSGITMLSKFVIEMRTKTIHLMILGSNNLPWQGKSLRNLQRLMPNLNLTFV